MDEVEAHLSRHEGMLVRFGARDRKRDAGLEALRLDTSTGSIAAIDDKVTRLTALLNPHGVDISAADASAGTQNEETTRTPLARTPAISGPASPSTPRREP
jgi:hypothetical protein